jgi:ketosteroid isomerase-like protein
MSEETVEIVRRFLAQAQEAPDAAWVIFDDQVEWETQALASPDFPRTARGPDAVREFFRRWVGAFDEWGYEAEEFVDGPNAVAVRIHQWGRGKGSGVQVDNRFWQLWFLRGGKAVRVTHAADRDHALKTAGLLE